MRSIPQLSLILSTVLVAGCPLPVEDLGTDGGVTAGGIYFKLHADYTCSGGCGWCDIISGNYTDDNNAVPDNATFEREYGPSHPGTYNARFDFDKNNPGDMTIAFNYTLAAPAPGNTRRYTMLLRVYHSQLGRCISMATDPRSLAFRDTPN